MSIINYCRLFFGGLFLMPAFLLGQDSTETCKKNKVFTFSGFTDVYYSYNTNNPLSRLNTGQDGNERIFDKQERTIAIGMVQTKFEYSTLKSGIVVDLAFGPSEDIGRYGSVFGPMGPTTGLAIKQAYFNYKPIKKLAITVGQFDADSGYESMEAPVNSNYSLSNLAGVGPIYYTGAKMRYTFEEDKFDLMAGVFNNLNSLYDNNSLLGFVAQAHWSPVKPWNLYLNYIYTDESNPKTETDSNSTASKASYYQLIDLVSRAQISDKFYIGVHSYFGLQQGDFQGTPHVGRSNKDTLGYWGGVALYLNYAFIDEFGINLRAEYFNNASGVRGLYNPNTPNKGTEMYSFTLSPTINLAEGDLIIKPEIRTDLYKKAKDADINNPNPLGIQQFQDSEGIFSKNIQTTITLALIYKFKISAGIKSK